MDCLQRLSPITQSLQDSSIAEQSLKKEQEEVGAWKVNHWQSSVDLQVSRHSSFVKAVSK